MSYFGLTGGIASGKSTVARMFEDFGVKVIDADRVGHEVLLASGPAYRDVLAEFGPEAVDASGEIDRGRLGRVVFADAQKLARLNAIVHPLIIRRVEEIAAAYYAGDRQAVVLVDAALIFEAGIGG
ncbi:MAG TPA: dephospho-CoA kinase, partial [Terriglobia bacterium]|nr:dephospho-CoA kinase [Terriglobia bacterium]